MGEMGRKERFGHALKIGKDQESEVSVGVLVTSSKQQADIPGPLFIPVESAWPMPCVGACRLALTILPSAFLP
jgi:hypothetical protein